MSDIAIKVEELSKLYRLGDIGTGTIQSDLQRWFARIRGKEDPFSKLGQTNDRTKKAESDFVWALKDINFEVKKGEVLGIIGRNGAGKSTLLKILSKITAPTTGKIYIDGRIASLLEVGTGFHPELSGRENIFMNGAILGMRKWEIKKKFDEIVDFAGVEAYIDTPVKRYSSGMYVRLAFAVAAFLEPEILIVDEVLAVGDAEFQKKCLGRMKDVSVNDGRTVLFVSHNMAAVRQLCSRGILLKDGMLEFEGLIKDVSEYYLQQNITRSNEYSFVDEGGLGNDMIRINRVAAFAKNKKPSDPIKTNDEVIVEIEFYNKIDNADLDVTWDIFDIESNHVCHVGTIIGDGKQVNKSDFLVRFTIPANLLNNKRYLFNVQFGLDQRVVAYKHENILSIDIEDGFERKGVSFHSYPGIIHPKFEWESISLSV